MLPHSMTTASETNKSQLTHQALHDTGSRKCEIEDKRRQWHFGQAHAPVDLQTYKEWVVPRYADQREPPLAQLKVDEELPYVVDREREKRLESIRNHVERRNPDAKL